MTTITRERLEQIANFHNQMALPPSHAEIEELARMALASLNAGSDSNNHPASGPLSDYRLHRIREILSKAAAQRDGGNLGYAMSDAVKAIDELLEVRKAEPVGEVIEQPASMLMDGCVSNEKATYRNIKGIHKMKRMPLGTKFYTTPPAPVAPATLPCAVELKPGLIIGKGCKTETLLTALQRRADYYAEIDAMTPEERAEHDANIEAFKAMLPQPTPVVQEDLLSMAASAIEDLLEHTDPNTNYYSGVWADVPGKLRAAMLNGGKS